MKRVLKKYQSLYCETTREDVLDASVAIRSKISLTKLLRMAIALFEIPVSGWTCLRTGPIMKSQCSYITTILDGTDPCRCKRSKSPF